MCTIIVGCGEDIGVASILEFETFAQLSYRHWEIASGDIGGGDSRKGKAQLFLIHCSCFLNRENTSWKIAYLGI